MPADIGVANMIKIYHEEDSSLKLDWSCQPHAPVLYSRFRNGSATSIFYSSCSPFLSPKVKDLLVALHCPSVHPYLGVYRPSTWELNTVHLTDSYNKATPIL